MITPEACKVVIGDWVCGRPVRSVGLCVTHYRRRAEGKPMHVIGTSPYATPAVVDAQCRATIDGSRCQSKAHRRGLCQRHGHEEKAGTPFTRPDRAQSSGVWLGQPKPKPERPSRTRKIDDMGESQLYHIPPVTPTQVGQALHALTTAGATPSDLPMLHRMLTEDVPLAYDQLTKTRRKRPA